MTKRNISRKAPISTLRRINIIELSKSIGIIVNEDGTIFDKITQKKFKSLVDWHNEIA